MELEESGFLTSDYILQSYSNQNSTVLAQKQTHRSMKQVRKPGKKPTYLWSKEARIYNGEKIVSSTSSIGKTRKLQVK